MKNKLLFDNTREHIVQVIKGAIMDMNMWNEAMHQDDSVVQALVRNLPQFICDILPPESTLYCIVDASWRSVQEPPGIGWSLHSRQGTLIMQGSSAIALTYSAFEAETMATLLAVQHLHRLRYNNVTILGDNAHLYKILEFQKRHKGLVCSEASVQIRDILNLASPNAFSFRYVPRTFTHYVDQLAKKARSTNQNYVISWL